MTVIAPRGTRVFRRFAIGIVILLALLITADRVGNYVAQRAVGNTIQTSQHLSARPDVAIAGFPFLTQLATGRFDKITVTASDVPVGSDAIMLRISRVQVVLHRITVSRDFSSVHADTATATALVSYAELGKTLGVEVGYDGGGRIKATKSVTVAGRTLSASITAQPKLVNNALSFGGTSINGLDRLSGRLATVLNNVFGLSVPLRGIPFRIRVKSLSVDGKGLHIILTGANLAYST